MLDTQAVRTQKNYTIRLGSTHAKTILLMAHIICHNVLKNVLKYSVCFQCSTWAITSTGLEYYVRSHSELSEGMSSVQVKPLSLSPPENVIWI